MFITRQADAQSQISNMQCQEMKPVYTQGSTKSPKESGKKNVVILHNLLNNIKNLDNNNFDKEKPVVVSRRIFDSAQATRINTVVSEVMSIQDETP